MHDAACLGLVHWDGPGGWSGEGTASPQEPHCSSKLPEDKGSESVFGSPEPVVQSTREKNARVTCLVLNTAYVAHRKFISGSGTQEPPAALLRLALRTGG